MVVEVIIAAQYAARRVVINSLHTRCLLRLLLHIPLTTEGTTQSTTRTAALMPFCLNS